MSFGIASGIIGTVGGLAQGLTASHKAGVQRSKQNEQINRRERENSADYWANAKGNYTQRADVQNMLTNLKENIAENNRQQNNRATVMGATPEAQAVMKDNQNQAIAKVYGNVAQIGQNYKDRITGRYQANKANIYADRNKIMEEKAKSYETMRDNGFNNMSKSWSGTGDSAADKLAANLK